jgi:hypothetical protein
VRALQELTLVVAILAGTIGGSQVPRFVQEYEQRLGGASQEAGRQLAEYRRVAEATGQPFADYLRRLSGNEDPSVAATGRTIAATEARAAGLGAQAEALGRASRLLKPLVLLRRHDPELLRATWARFEPTLTLDPGFAALGVLLGWLLHALPWGLARRRGRGRAPRLDARGLT